MTTLTSRFHEALTLAAELHAGQKRKQTEIPYVSHLLAVAAIALEHGADEDEAIAALLHDAVEDQGGEVTLEAIRQRLGETVADIVLGCSDTTVTPKPPWLERKQRYIEHVREASPSVRVVSAADKLHNLRAIIADYRTHGDQLWGRFNADDREQIVWYYRSLTEAFRDAAAPRFADAAKAAAFDVLVRELDLATGELEGSVADAVGSRQAEG
jgi:(p)ppGpp synthase/HD superfamily hydrolase